MEKGCDHTLLGRHLAADTAPANRAGGGAPAGFL